MKRVFSSIFKGIMTSLVLALLLSPGFQTTVFAASYTDGKAYGETGSPSIPVLFSQAAMAERADRSAVKGKEVIRSNYVNIDLSLLTVAADSPDSVSAPGRAVALNLFDNANFVADAVRVERTPRGVTWVGRLRGVELGEAVIIVNGDVVAGNITMPGTRFHIRFAGDGVHEVQEIDQSRFPADEPYVPSPENGGFFFDQSGDSAPVALSDDGSLIDVMVVYSAAARIGAGGTSAMQSLIDLAIAETNQSYQNSGVAHRLRLVHSTEVVFTETASLENALNCITNTADGCLDDIHALRDTYGADLVSFWVEDGGGYCGLGWMMSTVASSFASHGFNAVARSCATGYYSFGHELGHNMGCRHDVFVDSNTTPYVFAHGYANTAPSSPWRTVMAYNNACSAVGLNCSRLQYWSNPGVTYSGAPMGDSSADNRQTLNNTAYTVANFRAAVVNTTVPGAPTIGTATAGNASAEVSFSAPASNGGSPITGYTVTSSPGNISATGTASPITVTGLANGTEYTFAVTATNAVGTGPASAPSNGVTPSAPAAIDLGVAVDNTSLTWSTGGSANWVGVNDLSHDGVDAAQSGTITDNQSTWLETTVSGPGTASFWWKVSSEENYDYLSFFIDGVLQTGRISGQVDWNEKAYAVNGTGAHTLRWEYEKDYSVSSNADAGWVDQFSWTPSATVPGAPTIGTAAAGNASAEVSFSAPASTGGSAITGYTVTSNPGNISATGTASPITVTGLVNGTAYTFTVTATNAAGTGPASSPSNSTIPRTVPGAPVIGSATAGNVSATVNFSPPTSNGGSPITGYTVTSSPGNIVAMGTSSPITVTGLVNGTTYTFFVNAANAAGSGPASAQSNSVTPLPPPVRIGSNYYSNLQTGCDAVSQNGTVIELLAGNLSGGFTVTKPYHVTIKGGYDASFSYSSGTTSILGTVILGAGTTIIENLVVQ